VGLLLVQELRLLLVLHRLLLVQELRLLLVQELRLLLVLHWQRWLWQLPGWRPLLVRYWQWLELLLLH
jgi:hypothetical protein